MTELTLFCLCKFWTYFFRKKLITKQVNCIFLGKICCQTVYCYGKFLKKSYRFFQFEISLRHASKQKISSFIPRKILQNIEGNGHWNSNHITFWVNLKLFKEGKTMRRAKYRHIMLPGVFLDNTRFWFYRWCSSSIRYSTYKILLQMMVIYKSEIRFDINTERTVSKTNFLYSFSFLRNSSI